jgi:hypothetical protein
LFWCEGQERRENEGKEINWVKKLEDQGWSNCFIVKVKEKVRRRGTITGQTNKMKEWKRREGEKDTNGIKENKKRHYFIHSLLQDMRTQQHNRKTIQCPHQNYRPRILGLCRTGVQCQKFRNIKIYCLGKGDLKSLDSTKNTMLWQLDCVHAKNKKNKQTPWSESASELYRPSDRRFSAKWLPTFADKGCHVGSVTDPYVRILGFLDRSRYFSIK